MRSSPRLLSMFSHTWSKAGPRSIGAIWWSIWAKGRTSVAWSTRTMPRAGCADAYSPAIAAAAWLAVAERLLRERDATALSLREVTRGAGTSPRAVYSLFGSKEGLLGALGAHATDLLHEGVDAIPVTDDPRHDLVEAALMFRRFALGHPALFEVAFHRADPAVRPRFRATAADALAALTRRFEPLAAAGLLGGRLEP